MSDAPQRAISERKTPEILEADLRNSRAAVFQKGAWRKADILLVEFGGGRAVVKDFGRKIPPVRWYGRW